MAAEMRRRRRGLATVVVLQGLQPPHSAPSRSAVAALRAHLTDRPGLPVAPVFTRADGSALRASHVQSAWATARKRVGMDQVHFHDLRHAGLTLTAQLGATTAEVMRRAGHSSTRAAAIYQHAAEGRDVAIARLLSTIENGR